LDRKKAKIILGTVQFGLEYGITNKLGQPSYEECKKILDTAYSHGIRTLDTADAYGNSYEVIGRYHRETNNIFKVHTKFREYPGSFESYLRSVREKLCVEEIDYLYFHSFNDFLEKKKVGLSLELSVNLGLSIYSNSELEVAIEEDLIRIIQLPLNLLDHRGLKEGLIRKARDKGKVIATRSSFLQGLFFLEESLFPDKLKPLLSSIIELKEIAKNSGNSINEFALAYPLCMDEVDFVLMGVDSTEQLENNIEASKITLKVEDLMKIERIVTDNPLLLNPTNW